MPLQIRPITQRAARAWVESIHRHLTAPRGDVIRVAVWLVTDGEPDRLVGVAMAGRPTARHLQDGATLEITRVATDGTRDACSIAYGALRRAATALGWARLITYTLPEEGGASLRAAGFRMGGQTDGGEWSRPSRERRQAERADVKQRWVWP